MVEFKVAARIDNTTSHTAKVRKEIDNNDEQSYLNSMKSPQYRCKSMIRKNSQQRRQGYAYTRTVTTTRSRADSDSMSS